MMKRLVLLFALGVSACEREAPNDTAAPAPAAPDAILPGQESGEASRRPWSHCPRTRLSSIA